MFEIIYIIRHGTIWKPMATVATATASHRVAEKENPFG
jgi:hypothetical protein